jgi:hypothetical protein
MQKVALTVGEFPALSAGFSGDRTMAEYASEVWQTTAYPVS